MIFGARRPPPLDLTVAVTAWNMARELEGLLADVDEIAREVVVVDGGSEDDTAAVCRAHPKVRYLERPWDGHFGRQKNAAIAAAQGEWVLHLDADERVGPRLKAALPRVCARRVAFWRLPMLWLVEEQPARYVRSEKHYPCFVPRLFRNRPEHRYLEDEGPVHPRFPKAVTRTMKKLRGQGALLHYCLAWADREALRAKAADYARREPGSEETNAAYYLWWELPDHELIPVGDEA